MDPLNAEYPWNSPYAFSENQVIAFIELEGLEKVSYLDNSMISEPFPKTTQITWADVVHYVERVAIPDKSILLTWKFMDWATETQQTQDNLVVNIDVNKANVFEALDEVAFYGTLAEGGKLFPKFKGNAIIPSKPTTTIYRGVNESSPAYDDALKGIAKPRGGNATPAQHNNGNTLSNFTSWTTNREVAINYALRPLRPAGEGTVLRLDVEASRMTTSPSIKDVLLKPLGKVVNENEVLIQGDEKNAPST